VRLTQQLTHKGAALRQRGRDSERACANPNLKGMCMLPKTSLWESRSETGIARNRPRRGKTAFEPVGTTPREALTIALAERGYQVIP
jgi:hypothetical protein